MPYFPLFVSLEGRDVLIVGGGAVALRKARSLAPFGCRITAAAAHFCPGWEAVDARRHTAVLTGDEPALWHRPWALVIAASGDRALNRQIGRQARARRIPVNAADAPEECTFYFPALVRRGEMVAGLCSGGEAPFYTKKLRCEVERAIPAQDGRVLEAVRPQRAAARAGGEEAAGRLIDTLRAALEQNPDLTQAQLRALCDAFWQGEPVN